MMQMEQPSLPEIPWTTRDVWYGMGFLALWMILLVIVQFVFHKLAIDVDLGLFTTLSEVVFFIPVWLFGVRKYRVDWSVVGLRRFSAAFVGMGCGFLILSYLFNFIYGFLVLLPLHQTLQGDLLPTIGQTLSSVWLWIGGIIVAPIAEEVFFRGFVFGGLKQSFGWKKAALISAALFSVAHLQLTAVLPIFVLGFFFAYLVHRSHSLWPAILMHMLTNTVAFCAAYLLVR
jgi:membrane protease YdiL (CAAX protease family)